ncbi:hypothetical protein [Nocardia arthritidis]|uniref:Uncharacterized protein n=1 Tax=Nocardia arthritidis TaxID=228602 RepID=A0A6G9Y9T6_9NOCA|nr:hypothetical protein [Nocardia arthritidis]QIS09816.1 hypothetical protein F5544_09580 [Nocardia arthritidis]
MKPYSPREHRDPRSPEAQQIPITITAPDLPAPAVDARDALLAAIAAEAQTITAKQSGKGAEALETLARAYLLVSGGAATVPPSSRMRNLTVGHGISASSGEYVDMVIPE